MFIKEQPSLPIFPKSAFFPLPQTCIFFHLQFSVFIGMLQDEPEKALPHITVDKSWQFRASSASAFCLWKTYQNCCLKSSGNPHIFIHQNVVQLKHRSSSLFVDREECSFVDSKRVEMEMASLQRGTVTLARPLSWDMGEFVFSIIFLVNFISFAPGFPNNN